MSMKLISLVATCALSSGLANANPDAEVAPAPATTHPAANQTGPAMLSDSQMDGVVAGIINGCIPPLFDICKLIRCTTTTGPTSPTTTFTK